MHIAFLTPEYPHDQVIHAAGIGTSIKNLAVALTEKQITVSVFVYGQKEDTIFFDNKIKIHLIKSRRSTFATWYFYRKYIQKYINRYTSEDKIDLIEAPDWTGITAFMNLKAPLVIRLHGSDAYFCNLEKRKQKFKNFWFEKLGISKADAIVAPTTFAGILTKEIFKIKKVIVTIPNGISVQNFHNPQPEVFEEGLLVYIGTIIRKKGVLEFSGIMGKVISKFPKATLLLIGSDSFDIQTQSTSTWKLLENSLSEKTKQNVNYIGKVPYSTVQEYIKKANVCVFPTFAETLGMVTIEAMAMHKAIVSSNFGWTKELMVDNESGFLADPKNHSEFAGKIIDLLENRNLAKNIGRNAQKRAEEIFDIQRVADKNIEFYTNLIKL